MVLKDPRLCFVLPLWRDVFDHPPVAVLVLRDPLEVARSLEHRNDFPVSFGLALWRRYVQQSITSVEGLPVFVADYQSILSDPRTAIGDLNDFLADQGVAPGSSRTHSGSSRSVGARAYGTTNRTRTRSARAEHPLVIEQQAFGQELLSHGGGHVRWSAPTLPDEPSWVADFIQLSAEGEMVAVARAAAENELKWIKRSRLFGVTKMMWRVTSSGPTLSSDPERVTAEPLAPGASSANACAASSNCPQPQGERSRAGPAPCRDRVTLRMRTTPRIPVRLVSFCCLPSSNRGWTRTSSRPRFAMP